jgi:DNA-binding transcriptional LysR family regulator
MQIMNDLQIKYFLGVVNNGCNFRKAAEALYVSQSAISQHIISLGKELGVKLFDTSNKSAIKLNPGGRVLYEFFTEYYEKLAESVILAKERNNILTGELKFACGMGWEMSDIEQKINTFCAAYPNIDVQFDSINFRQMENGLKENYYDVIITTLSEFKDEAVYNYKPLYESQAVLLYSVKHRLADKPDLQIKDFRNDLFYILREEEIPTVRITLGKYCQNNGFIPQFKKFPNVDSILLAIESGVGCSILNRKMRICNNTAYKWLELNMAIPIGFIWKKSNTNPVLQKFFEHFFNKVETAELV